MADDAKGKDKEKDAPTTSSFLDTVLQSVGSTAQMLLAPKAKKPMDTITSGVRG